MKRLLVIALAVASTLFCIAIVSLWVRSYFVLDVWSYDSRDQSNAIRTNPGELCFRRLSPPFRATPGWNYYWYRPDQWSSLRPPASTDRWPGGFLWESGVFPNVSIPLGSNSPTPTSVRYSTLIIPDWALVLLFALFPAARVASHLKRRRYSTEGKCRVCGYDLRATPERCPECGTVAEPKAVC